MSVSCDKVRWRTSSRRDGWYHGNLRWASLNSGTGNLYKCTYIHTDVYTDSGVKMYLRERETDEVAIFRWTLSSGLFRWSLFIAWLNTACLCCTHTHRDTQFNMCYQFKEPMANLVNRVEVAGGHVQ